MIAAAVELTARPAANGIFGVAPIRGLNVRSRFPTAVTAKSACPRGTSASLSAVKASRAAGSAIGAGVEPAPGETDGSEKTDNTTICP